RLDCEQHVAETAEHMRADRLALVGAADLTHVALVRRHTEMVRPEPHQSLDEADLGAERGGEPRFGLVEIDLLRHAGPLLLSRRVGRGRGRRRTAGPGHRGAGALLGSALLWGPWLWGPLLRRALRLPLRPPGALKFERRARCRPARQQIRIGDAAGRG